MERRYTRLVGLLAASVVAALVVAFPPDAFAAPAARADDPDTVKAREFIKKASIHYKVGEYEAAIAAYKEAYKLRPVPALLFNIAQGYRLLGEWRQAKFFYEGAVRDGPDAPYADEAKQRITEMEEKLALTPAGPPVAAAPKPAPPAAAAPPSKPAPVAAAPVAGTATPPVPPAALPAPAPAPTVVAKAPDAAEEARGDEHEGDHEEGSWLPIGLGAGAGVLAVVSVACFVLANGSMSAATAQERPRSQVDGLLQAADAQWTGGLVAAAGAVGAGIGAGVLFSF